MGSVAVHVNRGDDFLGIPVFRRNGFQEGADERLAVGLQHGDLAVVGAVGDPHLRVADQRADRLAGEERVGRGVAGVDDTNNSALTGVVHATVLGVPGPVGATELQEVRGGVVRRVLRVRGDQQHLRIFCEVDGLVRCQVGAEAINRGGELTLDFDVFLLRNFFLLLLQVRLVLLDFVTVGVELLALLRFGRRKALGTAVVGSGGLFGQDHHVAAVFVGVGVKVLLGHRPYVTRGVLC